MSGWIIFSRSGIGDQQNLCQNIEQQIFVASTSQKIVIFEKFFKSNALLSNKNDI